MPTRDNFHLITGGPGSGKTTLINALAAGGFRVAAESGRQIIRAQVAIGGNAVHWGDRALFAELMLSHAIADYERLADCVSPVFFDHGIPDFAGYFRLSGMAVPDHVHAAVRLYRFAPTVFVAPPWREIYANDAERKQDFAEAEVTHDACVAACREAGYATVDLPKATVAERVAFVLERVVGYAPVRAREAVSSAASVNGSEQVSPRQT